MADKKPPRIPQTAFRFPPLLLKRIDRYRDELSKEISIKLTRAGVVQRLLAQALDRSDADKKAV